MRQQAVGFFTPNFEPEVQRRYLKLKRELGGLADLYIVAKAGAQVPAQFAEETCFYEFEALASSAPRVLGTSLLPGNCHLTMLAFAHRFPGYEHYWQIEYDVVFTGCWSTFWSAYATREADLLVSHLRTQDQEPGFLFWSSLVWNNPDNRQPVRAFLPIYRISRRGLEVLHQAVEQGAHGHFEGLIPSVLRAHGLKIEDFGEGRFYTSCHSRDGLMCLGTMRFRPEHGKHLLGKNLLYHPVKPTYSGLKWHEIQVLARHFRREPLRALGNLARSLKLVVNSAGGLRPPREGGCQTHRAP